MDKTNLAKLATGFALVLLISLGLCGANLALFSRFGVISGGAPTPPRSGTLTIILMGTGGLELIGILTGALGLIVLAVWAIGRRIITSREKKIDAP